MEPGSSLVGVAAEVVRRRSPGVIRYGESSCEARPEDSTLWMRCVETSWRLAEVRVPKGRVLESPKWLSHGKNKYC